MPSKTEPLWYAIDLSVCVGLAVVELPVSGPRAFCAAAGFSAVRMSPRVIKTTLMGFVFMVVLLRLG